MSAVKPPPSKERPKKVLQRRFSIAPMMDGAGRLRMSFDPLWLELSGFFREVLNLDPDFNYISVRALNPDRRAKFLPLGTKPRPFSCSRHYPISAGGGRIDRVHEILPTCASRITPSQRTRPMVT